MPAPNKNWKQISKINQHRRNRNNRRNNRPAIRHNNPEDPATPLEQDALSRSQEEPAQGDILRSVLTGIDNTVNRVRDIHGRISNTIDNIAGEGTSQQLTKRAGQVISQHIVKRAREQTPPPRDTVNEETGEATPAKTNMAQQALIHDVPMDQDAGGAPANSTSAGGASGTMGVRGSVSQPVGRIPRPLTLTHTFVKSYQIRIKTSPIDYVSQSAGSANGVTGIRLPFHHLPVDMLGFYMAPGEIEQCSEFGRSTLDYCRMKAYMYTSVVPFKTGEVVTGVGNNNIGITAVRMRDTREIMWGEFQTKQKDIIEKIFWGNAPQELPATNTPSDSIGPNPPAWVVVRDLDNRFTHYYNEKRSTITGTATEVTDALCYQSWPQWMNNVDKRWNSSITEGWIWDEGEWEYEPKNGYLFGHNWLTNLFMTRNSTSSVSDHCWSKNYHHYNANIDLNSGTSGTPGAGQPVVNIDPIYNQQNGTILTNLNRLNYGTTALAGTMAGQQPLPAINDPRTRFSSMRIDHNFNWMEGETPPYTINVPTAEFGLQPIVNAQDGNSNIDAWVVVHIETECQVTLKANPPYIYPSGQTANGPFAYPFFKTPQINYGKSYEIGEMGSNGELSLVISGVKTHGNGNSSTFRDIQPVMRSTQTYTNVTKSVNSEQYPIRNYGGPYTLGVTTRSMSKAKEQGEIPNEKINKARRVLDLK